MESESKPGDHVFFTPAPPSSALSNSSDEGKDVRAGIAMIARFSMSLSMSHLDNLGSGDGSPADWTTPYRCTGDCQLRGYHECPRCISIPPRKDRSCSTDTENGRSRSTMQRSASTVGHSKTTSIRRQKCGIISPRDDRWAHSRSFDMIDARKQKKASKTFERSESFFSLASLRRRSSGLNGNNTTRKTNKKQRKMYAKRLKKLRADKQVALTGSFLILSSLVCWLPYAITRSCFFPVHTEHWVDITAMWISFVNAFLDPLIYAFMNRRVKAKIREDFRALRGYFCSCCCVGRQDKREDQ